MPTGLVTELCRDRDTGVNQYAHIGRAVREFWTPWPDFGWGTSRTAERGYHARGLISDVCLPVHGVCGY